jgi:hypothetical protein
MRKGYLGSSPSSKMMRDHGKEKKEEKGKGENTVSTQSIASIRHTDTHLRSLKVPDLCPRLRQDHADPPHQELPAAFAHRFSPSFHRFERLVLHHASDRKDQRLERDGEERDVLCVLRLVRLGEDGLEGCLVEIREGKRRVGRGESSPGLSGGDPGGLGSDGDDGEIILGDSIVRGDAEVGPLLCLPWNPRLGSDRDLRDSLEGCDHGPLRLLVACGSPRLEPRADLCMAKLVLVATGAEVVDGGAESSMVESC